MGLAIRQPSPHGGQKACWHFVCLCDGPGYAFKLLHRRTVALPGVDAREETLDGGIMFSSTV